MPTNGEDLSGKRVATGNTYGAIDIRIHSWGQKKHNVCVITNGSGIWARQLLASSSPPMNLVRIRRPNHANDLASSPTTKIVVL
jgi:hypothetical protein